MDRPLIVLGAGGHAKVLIAALLLQQRSILGFVDPAPPSKSILGVKCLGTDNAISRYNIREIDLINGVGSIVPCSPRQDLFERFHKRGYHFAIVVHPTAFVASGVRLGEGVQIMAGAVVQTGCRIGANTIINTAAIIDHDCKIQTHVHIAPGSVLSGQVRVATGTHIGTGACVIQSVHIGGRSIVGAGAVVINDIPARSTVVGVPARPLHK